MTKPPNTVYGRMKKTGFMMGADHAMGPAFNMKAKPGPEPDAGEGEAAGGENQPPNLHDSGDNPNSCGSCVNFVPADDNGQPRCGKYDSTVTANMVCDDFEPKTGPVSDQDQVQQGQPPAGMPGA